MSTPLLEKPAKTISKMFRLPNKIDDTPPQPPRVDSKLTQTLVLARKKVRNGWVQGRSHGPGNRVCAGYAIEESAREIKGHTPMANTLIASANSMLMTAVLAQTNQLFACIPDWNDRSDRTHAEVLCAFDLAIEMSRK